VLLTRLNIPAMPLLMNLPTETLEEIFALTDVQTVARLKQVSFIPVYASQTGLIPRIDLLTFS
jgi:hypothetical protein